MRRTEAQPDDTGPGREIAASVTETDAPVPAAGDDTGAGEEIEAFVTETEVPVQSAGDDTGLGKEIVASEAAFPVPALHVMIQVRKRDRSSGQSRTVTRVVFI